MVVARAVLASPLGAIFGAVLPTETETAFLESDFREPGAARRASGLGLASAALRKA